MKLLETPRGGNNNKDAMLDWRSGCQSEDKCICHIHMTCIMIATCFCPSREHYRPIFAICLVAFVCMLHQVICDSSQLVNKNRTRSPTMK